MDVRVKAEPEPPIIGFNNGMQYVPYECLTQYHHMPPNGVEPPMYHYHPHHPINCYEPPVPHPYCQYPTTNTEEHLHHSAYEQSCAVEEVDPNQKYEYHEPDENFISIDDAKVRSFLLDLLQKEKQKKEEEEAEARRKLELREEEEKSVEPPKDVAEETNDSDEESTLNDIDFDDDGEIVLLDSDVDIDENEEGIELNWIDLEQKAQKQTIECFLCGKSVVSSYNLRRHMMIHTGERPYGCDMCYKRFREFSDLKKHRRVHATQTNYKCMVCRINDPSQYDPTKCVECDKNSAGDGAQQMADLLLDSVPNVATTSPGGKKQFPCPMCNRIFGTRHNLKRHFMIHTGEKPFSCNICQKPFREVSTLKKHLHTHTKVKVYKCATCQEKFTDYDSFMEHRDTHPKKSTSTSTSTVKRMRGLKGHAIPMKRRRSDTESALADDDEEFECPECGEKSASIELYADHIKQHDSTVEFQCYICKQMFESRDLLVSHFTLHDVDDESSAEG